MKTITASQRVEGKGQTCDYIEHLQFDDRGGKPNGKLHMLRVRVHLDTVPAQAWGKVERWTGSTWATVADVRGDALTTSLSLDYERTASRVPEAFKADRDQLIRLAEEVL